MTEHIQKVIGDPLGIGDDGVEPAPSYRPRILSSPP